MHSPVLALFTGPEAGDAFGFIANAIRQRPPGKEHLPEKPWGFRVADYWEYPRGLLSSDSFDFTAGLDVDFGARVLEHNLCKTPEGAELVVGQVLEDADCPTCDGMGTLYDPDLSWSPCCPTCSEDYIDENGDNWGPPDEGTGNAHWSAGRYAIFAATSRPNEEPPPLLVQRVKDWGGVVLECFDGHHGDEDVVVIRAHDGREWHGDTWQEVARKVGEEL